MFVSTSYDRYILTRLRKSDNLLTRGLVISTIILSSRHHDFSLSFPLTESFVSSLSIQYVAERVCNQQPRSIFAFFLSCSIMDEVILRADGKNELCWFFFIYFFLFIFFCHFPDLGDRSNWPVYHMSLSSATRSVVPKFYTNKTTTLPRNLFVVLYNQTNSLSFQTEPILPNIHRRYIYRLWTKR